MEGSEIPNWETTLSHPDQNNNHVCPPTAEIIGSALLIVLSNTITSENNNKGLLNNIYKNNFKIILKRSCL